MGKGDRERAADAARQRERRRLAHADAASPPLPDADGGSTSGGGGGAGGDASDDDADMREALDASRFDVGARDVHDDAALLARLRHATELSLDDAARAERADAAEDDDLRAALRASAASASTDDADGADILRAMRSSRRVARRVAARARSRSDDEAIDYYTALSHSERDGAGARDTDGERDGAIARGTVGVAAEGYKLDVAAMFDTFYGLPLSPSTRTTHDGAATPGGFGVCWCGVSVTECNGKGWLHSHGLFWAGIPSWAFNAIVRRRRSAHSHSRRRHNLRHRSSRRC